MHCWWGESASYVLSLLKSFLMEWKPYILFPNEAQEWQTAPLELSSGCLQVEASSPSQAALRGLAGDVRPGHVPQSVLWWQYHASRPINVSEWMKAAFFNYLNRILPVYAQLLSEWVSDLLNSGKEHWDSLFVGLWRRRSLLPQGSTVPSVRLTTPL